MKFLTLALKPTDLVLHPIDQRLTERADVTRDSLLHLDVQVDGTYLLLYRLTGDRDALADVLDHHDDVLAREFVNSDDGSIHAFVHAAGTSNGGRLVELASEHTLIVDTPLALEQDELCATLVGTDANLRNALTGIPDDIVFAVRDAGEYDPDRPDLLSQLTDRQLEVFNAAVEEGYYDVPRSATHRDIAGRLSCASSTVDEHLRKAESRVVTRLF